MRRCVCAEDGKRSHQLLGRTPALLDVPDSGACFRHRPRGAWSPEDRAGLAHGPGRLRAPRRELRAVGLEPVLACFAESLGASAECGVCVAVLGLSLGRFVAAMNCTGLVVLPCRVLLDLVCCFWVCVPEGICWSISVMLAPACIAKSPALQCPGRRPAELGPFLREPGGVWARFPQSAPLPGPALQASRASWRCARVGDDLPRVR